MVFSPHVCNLKGFPGGSAAKNLPGLLELPEMRVWFLGREGPPGEGMATRCSPLAWRTPRTEESGGPQSMGSQGQTRLKQLSKHACTHAIKKNKMGLITHLREFQATLSTEPNVFIPSVCSVTRLLLRDQCLKERDNENLENFVIFSNVSK